MAQFHASLNEDLRAFIARQHIFFTATAPARGRINLSPKGMDTLRVPGERSVAYLNLTGSGNETAAHLLTGGRITLMFCSFDAQPLILRLYGHGRAVHPRDAEWSALYALFEPLPGARQIIVVDVESVQTSCGFAVPEYTYKSERDTLRRWAEKKGQQGLADYWRDKNQTSIDGLPTGMLEE